MHKVRTSTIISTSSIGRRDGSNGKDSSLRLEGTLTVERRYAHVIELIREILLMSSIEVAVRCAKEHDVWHRNSVYGPCNHTQ